MNHIHRLVSERDELRAQLRSVRDMLTDLESYLLSDKFRGADNDYAHVRTDMLPHVTAIRFAAIEGA